MPVSNLNNCLDEIVKIVRALNLNLNGVLPPVVKRKLPKKDQQLDPPIQITVCAKELPDKVTNITFANYTLTYYYAQVTIVSPNDGDELSNIDVYANWRQQIRQKLQAPPLGVLNIQKVIDVDTASDVFLDRKQISNLYDYQAVGIDLQVVEERTV